jgi:hypothetical protein
MSANQQHSINYGAIGDKSRHKSTDAVSDDYPPCPRESLANPFKRRGTILASPIFNGTREAAK